MCHRSEAYFKNAQVGHGQKKIKKKKKRLGTTGTNETSKQRVSLIDEMVWASQSRVTIFENVENS